MTKRNENKKMPTFAEWLQSMTSCENLIDNGSTKHGQLHLRQLEHSKLTFSAYNMYQLSNRAQACRPNNYI